MTNFWDKLVKEKGEEGAKAYMREIRSKRTINVGGGFNKPETRQKAIDTRNASKDKSQRPPIQPVDKD